MKKKKRGNVRERDRYEKGENGKKGRGRKRK